MSLIDLDAYLQRIGYTGPRAATLETLAALHALHPAAIAFENLNPLLGWPVPLDIASLQVKMVQGRRGGWCFEHNTLFAVALAALGYRVTALAARVLWNAPAGASVGARSHMLLRVDIEGQSYLADVGFGGNVLTAPLRLEPGIEQPTPHEAHRLRAIDGGNVLELQIEGSWAPLYRFTLEPQFPSDYDVSSWHLCHHPRSVFRQMLMAARALPGERRMLRNNAFSRRQGDASEQRVIPDAAQLRAVLEGEFDIDLPRTAEVEAMLARPTESRS